MLRRDGASVRIYNLAKGLALRHHKVEVIIPKEVPSVERLEGFRVNGVKGFFPTSILGVLRKFIGVSRPTALYFYDALFIFRITRLIRQVDIVQIEQQTAGSLLVPFIKMLLRKPVVVDCHDVFQALRLRHTGVLRRMLETTLEKMAYKYADLVLAVSEKEKSILISYGLKRSRIEVIPNGVDPDLFATFPTNGENEKKYPNGDSQVVVFVGNMEYLPNREAVELLSSTIAPNVLSKIRNAKFIIVGKVPESTESKNLIFTGLVKSVPKVLLRSDVAVAPLLHGSGTRLKILEYFAAGLPVVSTSAGAEGLAITNGKNILIEDDLSDFSSRIVELLKDQKLRSRIGNSGRDLVMERYDWRIMTEKLSAILRATVERTS